MQYCHMCGRQMSSDGIEYFCGMCGFQKPVDESNWIVHYWIGTHYNPICGAYGKVRVSNIRNDVTCPKCIMKMKETDEIFSDLNEEEWIEVDEW